MSDIELACGAHGMYDLIAVFFRRNNACDMASCIISRRIALRFISIVLQYISIQ